MNSVESPEKRNNMVQKVPYIKKKIHYYYGQKQLDEIVKRENVEKPDLNSA